MKVRKMTAAEACASYYEPDICLCGVMTSKILPCMITGAGKVFHCLTFKYPRLREAYDPEHKENT